MLKKIVHIFLIFMPGSVLASEPKNWQLGFQKAASQGMEDIVWFHDYMLLPIITAITVENKLDIKKYNDFLPFSEIILFDSKGYEKSLGFDHSLLENIPNNFKRMIAGNLKTKDILKFKNKDYIIDVSGGLEDINGKKSISKIDKFLIEINKI